MGRRNSHLVASSIIKPLSLKHFPNPDDPTGKLMFNKIFNEALKNAGFKWKQQTNDPDTGIRKVSFLARRPGPKSTAPFEEPISLKSCILLQDGPMIKYNPPASLPPIKRISSLVSEHCFHFFTNNLANLRCKEDEKDQIVEALKRIKGTSPATV